MRVAPVTGVAWLAAADAAQAAVRDVWVAAVPVSFNVMPWGPHDPITGTTHDSDDRLAPTAIFRRTTRMWRRPLRNSDPSTAPRDQVPGPLIRARVGDTIRVHFENLDSSGRSHSMHFQGVRYAPSSDGSFVPGVSGPDGEVKPGGSWTYTLHAIPEPVGVWPYHDHSTSMHESIEGGLYGALSIVGRRERAA